MKLFMLLALMLPLQSFASLNCRSPDTASLETRQHCQDPAGRTQAGETPAGGLAQHHHCGSCCVAAVAAVPLRFTPPSFAHPAISLPAYRPWSSVALDRLDRPPRLVYG
jgi:hypothetical protein